MISPSSAIIDTMSISITRITARQILDSRGNPTIEADVILSDGTMGRAAVPSGASTGSGEALELRDGDNHYGGKAVGKAVGFANSELANAVIGLDPHDQRTLDKILIDLDGTKNKSKYGANAILAISLASAKAAALSDSIPLHQHVAQIAGTTNEQSIPLPMMNIMNGGSHAGWSSDIQEFMVLPVGARSFADAIEMGANIFHALAKTLKNTGYATTVGDEGGYAPKVVGGNVEPLDLIMSAISAAGYKAGSDVVLGLDVAASEFFKEGTYNLSTEHRTLNPDTMIQWLEDLKKKYPLVSIEDGLAEDDWDNWKILQERVGHNTQLVGDDLLVTNTTLLRKGIDQKSANAILIKPNQIGSLSETIDAVLMAKKAGWNTVMSHRSGETEDVTIAHLAVGLGTGQIKTGSLSRTERIAKYNEILRIQEQTPSLQLARPLQKYLEGLAWQ